MNGDTEAKDNEVSSNAYPKNGADIRCPEVKEDRTRKGQD